MMFREAITIGIVLMTLIGFVGVKKHEAIEYAKLERCWIENVCD